MTPEDQDQIALSEEIIKSNILSELQSVIDEYSKIGNDIGKNLFNGWYQNVLASPLKTIKYNIDSELFKLLAESFANTVILYNPSVKTLVL